MTRIFTLCSILVMGFLISGCATSAENVQAAYISPVAYDKFTCKQIADEVRRVSEEVAVLTGQQDRKASNDAVATGVALVLFWPAAFLIDGDDNTTSELARMKGKFESLKDASEKKSCKIEFKIPEPPQEEVDNKDIDEF